MQTKVSNKSGKSGTSKTIGEGKPSFPYYADYQLLEKMLQVGLWELDMSKNRFRVSENCYALLGIKAGSIIKLETLFAKCIKKDDQERIEKGLLSLCKDGEEFATDFRITGRYNNLEESRNLHFACMVKNGGEFPLISGYFQDVTSRKKLEKELYKAKNKAEKADRFKSVFLSNLSHEIRNPMNAIMGFAELLNQNESEKALTREYTSIIKSKGQYLMTLIDDVIELSRFEAGAISMSRTEVDLYTLMKELHKEFSERMKLKGKTNLELKIEVDRDDRELRIFTDSGRLHQVLFNLISNAIKFTERGSVLFGYRSSNKNIKFFVEDTGIGLGDEDQHRILNRFEEIENTPLRKLEGTGLSLTISRLIVESLGGKLKVKSELGKGSVFQVNIPIQYPLKKVGGSDKESHLPQLNWKDKVILVAEDEELNFRFLEAVLEKTGAKILQARNGQEAVDLVRSITQIDIVLLDIKMPVKNGYEALSEIKRIKSNLPVIAQTAYATQEEMEKCLLVGCDDYITKPIDINLLSTKINRFFQT